MSVAGTKERHRLALLVNIEMSGRDKEVFYG